MKFRSILISVLCIFVALVSCKKNDNPSEAPSLEGVLRMSDKLPLYVTNGERFTFVPYGVSVPGSKAEVSYFCYLSTKPDKRDTSSLWKVAIPALDTLGSITLYGYAWYPGYSLKSITSSATIVNDRLDGKGSITGFDIKAGEDYVEGESGRKYYVTEAGGRKWMRQNLAEGPQGVPYKECEVNSYIFGRYYSWDEAMNVCPDGWELPSRADWDNLLKEYPLAGDNMADLKFNGKKMWEYWPKVKINDASRLSIMPSGYATFSESEYLFQAMNNYAVFWTSDLSADDPEFAVARYIYEDRNEVFSSAFDRNNFMASVRCVKKRQDH